MPRMKDGLRAMASTLAGESTKLFEESARLQSSASHFDFVREVFSRINSNMTALEAARENLRIMREMTAMEI